MRQHFSRRILRKTSFRSTSNISLVMVRTCFSLSFEDLGLIGLLQSCSRSGSDCQWRKEWRSSPNGCRDMYYQHGEGQAALEMRAALKHPRPSIHNMSKEDANEAVYAPPGNPGGSDAPLIKASLQHKMFEALRIQTLFPGAPIACDSDMLHLKRLGEDPVETRMLRTVDLGDPLLPPRVREVSGRNEGERMLCSTCGGCQAEGCESFCKLL